MCIQSEPPLYLVWDNLFLLTKHVVSLKVSVKKFYFTLSNLTKSLSVNYLMPIVHVINIHYFNRNHFYIQFIKEHDSYLKIVNLIAWNSLFDTATKKCQTNLFTK